MNVDGRCLGRFSFIQSIRKAAKPAVHVYRYVLLIKPYTYNTHKFRYR